MVSSEQPSGQDGSHVRGATPELESPSVTVLVTTCADSEDLRSCLRMIRTQADEIGAALLLVVNAKRKELSEDSFDALSAIVSRVLFVASPGKSNALNAAVDTVDSDVIAFTDDDAMPRPGWLKALTAPLLDPDRPARRVGTGGRLHPTYPDRGMPAWYKSMIEGRPASVLGPRHDFGDESFAYEFAGGSAKVPIGANCAYRREVFDRFRYATDLGPNRVSGLKGGEDTELALRLMMEGFGLQYVPDAIVDHPVHSDRLGIDYCKPRFFSHGVELARLRKRLGIPLKSRFRLRWERRLAPALHLLRPFGWSRERIALEREKLRGMLHELDSGSAAEAPE